MLTPKERAQIEQQMSALKAQMDYLDPEKRAKMGGEMALEGVSGPQKFLINLGAGMSNLGTGAMQLLGQGPSDSELLQDRARNEVAAASQTGGGLTQLAGEILPTLAVPMGGFANSARGVANLVRMALGTKTMPALKAARFTSGAGIADNTLAGMASGALQPVTSDESRGLNTALGGLGGAVLPTALAVPKLGSRLVTAKGAEGRAGSELLRALGGETDAAQAVKQVKNYKPGAFVSDIPMATNEILQDTTLAALQRPAAARDPVRWADLMAAQNEGRFNALMDATQSAEKLDVLRTARDASTEKLRETALRRAAADPWFHEPAVKATLSALEGNTGSSPAVQRVAGYVLKELGNGVTPERLYTVRKTLASGLSKPANIAAPDELAAATKLADRETKGLIAAIDESLDKSSKGKWTPYLTKYQEMSNPVVDARATGAIRDKFTNDAASLTQGLGGQVPSVTGRQLGQAMEKYGQNSFGDTLSYGTRDALNQLRENIGRSETLQSMLKKAGTSGGGSNTAMDVAQIAAAQNRISRVGQLLHLVTGYSEDLKQKAMSDALSDPGTFVRVVENKLKKNLPLTNKEEIVLLAIRGTSPQSLQAGSLLLGSMGQE